MKEEKRGKEGRSQRKHCLANTSTERGEEMKPYSITYNLELGPNGEWGPNFLFIVKRGQLQFPVAVDFSRMLVTKWERIGHLNEKELEQITLRIGVERILKMLAAGDVPQETEKTKRIFVTPDNGIELDTYRQKACKFQSSISAGLICEIAVKDDELNSETCQPICDECGIPDSRVLCSHLSHPESYSSAPSRKRMISGGLCERNEDPGDTTNCWPRHNRCWELLYKPPEVAKQIPSDLSERVVDEIDFLNLAFIKVYESKILDVPLAGSIGSLYGSCSTREEFIFKVQVVADLINKLSPPKDLLKRKLSKDELKKNKKGLDQLGVFLDKFFSGSSSSSICSLKAIKRVRNDFPAHSGTEKKVLEEFEILDIPYPVFDYQKSWERVLFVFWSSLRDLRRLIMSGAE